MPLIIEGSGDNFGDIDYADSIGDAPPSGVGPSGSIVYISNWLSLNGEELGQEVFGRTLTNDEVTQFVNAASTVINNEPGDSGAFQDSLNVAVHDLEDDSDSLAIFHEQATTTNSVAILSTTNDTVMGADIVSSPTMSSSLPDIAVVLKSQSFLHDMAGKELHPFLREPIPLNTFISGGMYIDHNTNGFRGHMTAIPLNNENLHSTFIPLHFGH